MPVILNKIDELIVNRNETIEAKYFIQKSNVPVKVDWLKNDKIFSIDGSKYAFTFIEEEGSYSLLISGCEIKDSGKYSISVSNLFGKTISDFRLLIRCKIFTKLVHKFNFYLLFINYSINSS